MGEGVDLMFAAFNSWTVPFRTSARVWGNAYRYAGLAGLRFEASQKLNKFRPATVGQASRVDGVTPADIAILLVHLEKAGRH